MISSKGKKPKMKGRGTKRWPFLYARMPMVCGILELKIGVWQMSLFKFLQLGDMKIEIFISTRFKRLKYQRPKFWPWDTARWLCYDMNSNKDPCGGYSATRDKEILEKRLKLCMRITISKGEPGWGQIKCRRAKEKTRIPPLYWERNQCTVRKKRSKWLNRERLVKVRLYRWKRSISGDAHLY